MSDKLMKKLQDKLDKLDPYNLDSSKREKIIKYTKMTGITIMSFYLVVGMIGYINFYYEEDSHLFPLNLVYGYGPNDPECFELGECDLFAAPFDAMVEPYDAVFEGFTFVVIWAIIMGILWLRVSNTMMVGIIGIVLASLFTRPDPVTGELTGFSEEAQAVGWGLLILAVVVVLYQILTVRVHFPTN